MPHLRPIRGQCQRNLAAFRRKLRSHCAVTKRAFPVTRATRDAGSCNPAASPLCAPERSRRPFDGGLRVASKPITVSGIVRPDLERRAWADEGSKIIEAMERGSGLTFLETHVRAVIFEGTSRSGVGDTPMYLRASYPADVKKATLVHEHGHRLIAQLRNRPTDLDEHRVLFLFLYDVWESLWGKDFADEHVKIESGRTGLYDYETAWKWALSMSKGQRASRLADIVKTNRR